MISEVRIFSRGTLPAAQASVWLISITDRGRSKVNPEGWGAVLPLCFDDACRESDRAKLAGVEEVESVRRFVAEGGSRTTATRRLFVQCEHGMSRSAAIALCIAVELGLPLWARATLDSLADERGERYRGIVDAGLIIPNRHVVGLFSGVDVLRELEDIDRRLEICVMQGATPRLECRGGQRSGLSSLRDRVVR